MRGDFHNPQCTDINECQTKLIDVSPTLRVATLMAVIHVRVVPALLDMEGFAKI